LATEENLYLCILDAVWGSKTNKIAHWLPGDQLLVYVARALAALFTITGEPYDDSAPIWPGDLYPYRVPIRLEKIVHPADRYSLKNADVRELLSEHHTSAYGVVLVLDARPLDEAPARRLLLHLDQAPGWAGFDANQLLQALRAQRLVEQAALAEEVLRARPDVHEPEASPHTQMQFYLAQLGRALHFQVWIPKGDRWRDYLGTPLRQLSLPELPALPFNDHAVRIIRNIDVIWLDSGHPAYLFEVEHTTSIYSGLLRMSDLAALIPSLNIGMVICAEAERKNKVIAEVNRPTFARRPVPLARRCRFISFEKLAEFMGVQRNYLSHFNTSILDELSESLENPSDDSS
jgi:hypothetical protein